MSDPTKTDPIKSREDPLVADWNLLHGKVQELLALTETLARENRALRTQQRNWSAERAKLIEKNELAKSRVESMITRLKALEQDA
ncbi:MAG: TIGR02449 family protein [Pseudomonadota bacterium]